MSANFLTFTTQPNATREDVREQFSGLQADDRHENGRGLTGGWSQADGIEFASVLDSIRTYEPTRSFVQANAQKWGAAMAVEFVDAAGERRFLVGAWCAC